MVTINCPVSSEWINGNQVRCNALIVFLLSLLTYILPAPYLILALSVDFFIRGFAKSSFSYINRFSALIVNFLQIGYIKENKAPKIFAAKIGLVITLLYALLYFAGQHFLASIVLYLLLLFSFLEFSLKICAGCYVYTFLQKIKWVR